MGGCRQFRLVKDGKPIIVLILETIPVYPDSMDMHEIAAATGLSVGNVKVILSRMRRRFKEIYYKR